MVGRSASSRAFVTAVVSIALGWLSVAQERNGAVSTSVPRMSNGRPDLQGVYSFATATPLERPASLASAAVLTPEEAADFERQQLARRAESDGPRRDGSVGGYNQFWYEFGTTVVSDRRTSLIVDPPDGRLPPLTPAGQRRADAHRAQLKRPAEGPEDRDASERCILGYNAGPPMVPAGYNQHVQIVQTPDNVAIHNEMVHNARIVPTDGRSHLPAHLRTWAGDSRGRWEGDTLVVETRNFNNQVWNQFSQWNWASDEQMHVVERFTRIDADTLRYEFTVADPTVWTKPWTAVVPLRQTTEPMYEYACHEGNYGMAGILRGARADETAGRYQPTRPPN
jgi:hypothetical protein